MKSDKAYWAKIVTKTLKAELAKRGMSYPSLVGVLCRKVRNFPQTPYNPLPV